MRFTLATTDRQGQRLPHGLLDAAEVFLNDRLGASYFGPGLTHIALIFRKTVPNGRKPKTAWRYKGSFAEHLVAEIVGEDVRNSELTVAAFQEALTQIIDRVLSTSELWQGEFRANDFAREFQQSLNDLPVTDSALRQYALGTNQHRARADLNVLRGDEEQRFQISRPCTVQFVGLRNYPSKSLEGKLNPHLAIYEQLLEGLLRNLGWMTPGYREVYINIAETLDQARLNRVGIEDWHENAYAVIRLADYEAASDVGRMEIVFTALVDALRALATIDHLDQSMIDQAVAQIRATGTDTDLKYLSAENKRHSASVLYRAMDDGGAPAFRLEVFDKSAGRRATVDLGRHEMWWLPYRFGRLKLSTKEVTIDSRKSERAKVLLQSEKAPEKLSFKYQDLFAAGS